MHGTRWLPDDSPTELARVRQPAPPGIIVHNGAIADDEICTVQSIFCTTPARTVYDIGRRADCGQLSRCTRHTSATQRFVPSRWRRRIDMGWPEWKVGVEYDGEQHWTDSNRHAEDIERLEYLAVQGWITVRVGARQLRYDRAGIPARSDARWFSTCRSPGRTSFRAGLPRPSAAGAAAGRSAAP